MNVIAVVLSDWKLENSPARWSNNAQTVRSTEAPRCLSGDKIPSMTKLTALTRCPALPLMNLSILLMRIFQNLAGKDLHDYRSGFLSHQARKHLVQRLDRLVPQRKKVVLQMSEVKLGKGNCLKGDYHQVQAKAKGWTASGLKRLNLRQESLNFLLWK